MSTMKIKTGDTVKVIAGKDKDKEGKVIAVNKKDGRVLVEGVNMLTKHTKPSAANQNGGIVHQEGYIDASNVMLMHKGQATRVGFKMDGDKKVRFAKKTGEVQKGVVTRAKNSVANFKIREGMPIGCKVTLRGEKMYEFVDRLINLALPRVRDFRGVNPNAFDGRGNYALGIKEQLIFPEIEYDKIDKVRGMDVIFVTTAKTDEEARELLKQFNMPFAK